ncbi:hypothetical protein [Candidatus Berkiella aquae]|uniref:Invasion associated locus B (IalB) protein n=1 Tax=Candidatus Berkiella aquae TaxID=295108 RepID=A0A0Q9YLI5_9GAMM|nr:hypothetical protein [Candidatus Berkiella aquae]MCS5711555.1 hypothetical protein [Candidatus Berkiella aquae]
MLQCFKAATLVLIIATSSISFADPSIDKAHPCTMKDIPVVCANGEKINLDVIRSTDHRGEVFININTKDQIGNYLLLYIDNRKPEVLKVEKGTSTVDVSKGAFIPTNIILKLQAANSVHFKIGMKQGTPLTGSLNQNHFDWLKSFGKVCG